MGLHFMDLWQSSKTNPAYLSESKIVMGLPSLHLNYYNTSGDFNQVIVDYIEEETTIKAGDALSNLSEEGNLLRGGSEVETLSFGYRLGDIQIGISHAQKTFVLMDYPQTLAKLFFEGNGQYVGQTIALDHDIDMISYNEFALSSAKRYGNLTVGVRAKYLTGIASATVVNNKISLNTDSDIYQLTLNSDYQLNTSSFINSDDLNNFNFAWRDYRLKDVFTKNVGYAVDFGVTYEVNDKLKIAASVLDIGEIKWTENVNNYSSKGASTYDGFDFAQFSTNDSISFNSALDTLENTFNFDNTNEEYTTTLPTKFYLSASYQLNDMIRLAGAFYNENYKGQNYPMVAVGANAQITKLLAVGGTYSARKDSAFNLGLNFAIKLGPAQIYATADNILAVTKTYERSNANIRTGLNLLF